MHSTKVHNEVKGSAMDKIWQLLKAMFVMLVGAVSLLCAYILFADTGLAFICGIVAYICIPVGMVSGLLVIIDRHREQKENEE